MPVAPQPYKLSCSKCSWSRVVAMKSDAIVIGIDKLPEQECPRCGCDELIVNHDYVSTQNLPSSISHLLKRLLKM